jgi:hypothetical protein
MTTTATDPDDRDPRPEPTHRWAHAAAPSSLHGWLSEVLSATGPSRAELVRAEREREFCERQQAGRN